MNRLAVVLASVLAITPAFAWDNDPASFRADPQAWVRNTVVPGCKAPAPKDEAFCACIVSIMAQQVSEADVARVNEPGADKVLGGKTIGASMQCGIALKQRP